MRANLANKNHQRLTFRGTVGRFGRGHGHESGAKIMLIDVHQKGSPKAAGHLWLNYRGECWQQLGELFCGDLLEFDGRIRPYVKGGGHSKTYAYAQTDYEIIYLTNIHLIKKARLPKGWVRNENLTWMDATQFDRWSKFHMHRQFDVSANKPGFDKQLALAYQKQRALLKMKERKTSNG